MVKKCQTEGGGLDRKKKHKKRGIELNRMLRPLHSSLEREEGCKKVLVALELVYGSVRNIT